MLKKGHVVGLVLLALGLLPELAAGVHLRGSVLHVGFPGSAETTSNEYVEEDIRGDHYRVGAWVPILVELTNDDPDRFEGVIEARQPDRDGDEVLARREVFVQGTRRYFLYVPGGREPLPQLFAIRVYDLEGGPARLRDDGNNLVSELICSRPIGTVPTEARMILDISPRPVLQKRVLVGGVDLAREVFLARGSVAQLPDDPAGLEMVDTIVWSDVDPGLLDIAQRRALEEWMRHGGTLVLAVSRSWEVVAKSGLAELLPGKPTAVGSLSEPPEWLSDLLGVDVFDAGAGRLDPPLVYSVVTRGDLVDTAEVMVPPDEAASGNAREHVLIARRPQGRGQVILVAADLGELMKHGRRNADMLRDLLAVRRLARAPETDTSWRPVSDLFNFVRRKTTFGTTASLYLGFAFLFVGGYIALATGGTWVWLRRRAMLQHNWVAFSCVVLIATVTSLAAVQWIRGISYRVHELSVVDGRAGSQEAVATCYFGLKAPAHVRLDLRVPRDLDRPDADDTFAPLLMPMPAEKQHTVYGASERYRAISAMGELHGVPMRASLKQFEAHWSGRMPGRLTASLHRRQAGTLELAPESWVQNELETDLHTCYLFVASRDVESSRSWRGLNIAVYPIDQLPAGQRRTWQQLADMEAMRSGSAVEPNPKARRRLLDEMQRDYWLKDLSISTKTDPYGYGEEEDAVKISVEHFANALLVLTFFDELNPDDRQQRSYDLLRSYGYRLDRSDQLTNDTALFVGFSRDPGPARLCMKRGEEFRPLEPASADVLYRIAIPIEELHRGTEASEAIGER